ncbi:hypothetical protein M3570_21165, partial [Bacillus subtilis]|nr:hypothetical protein [Bacillus subtilis]
MTEPVNHVGRCASTSPVRAQFIEQRPDVLGHIQNLLRTHESKGVGSPHATNEPRTRIGKVRWQNQRIRVGMCVKERSPGLAGLIGIDTKPRAPVRIFQLKRCVKQVTGYNRPPPIAFNANADVPRC